MVVHIALHAGREEHKQLQVASKVCLMSMVIQKHTANISTMYCMHDHSPENVHMKNRSDNVR